MTGSDKTSFSIRKVIMCSLFAALIIVGAYIKIPIPPVPVTLQSMFVLLSGAVLGHKLGLVSVLVYVILGLVGLPVFTGGAGGLGYILSPSFGYIIGFLVAVCIIGKLCENSYSYKRILCASFISMAVIYLCGMIYYCLIQTLYLQSSVDIKKFIISFFLLPLPKDIIVCFAVALTAGRIKQIKN